MFRDNKYFDRRLAERRINGIDGISNHKAFAAVYRFYGMDVFKAVAQLIKPKVYQANDQLTGFKLFAALYTNEPFVRCIPEIFGIASSMQFDNPFG